MIKGEGLKIIFLLGEKSLLVNCFNVLEWSKSLCLDGGEKPIVDPEKKFEVIQGIDGSMNPVTGSPLFPETVFNFNRGLDDGNAESYCRVTEGLCWPRKWF